MSSTFVTVDTFDVEFMLNRLDTATSPAGLATFLTGVVAPYIKERAERRFSQEGDDASGKWAPLRPATQEIRSRGPWPVEASSPINVRTTELERYVTQSDALATPHALGATLKYPGKKTTKKTIVEKMRTAQLGRSKPRTVARPVLTVNETDLAYVTQQLVFYVNKSVVR